jgi:flagellar biosynthesis repressor protein FlbT
MANAILSIAGIPEQFGDSARLLFPHRRNGLLMSLKVELKPHERLIVGNCIITNSDQRARLFIDGKAPVLREKDILSAATADSPAKRIYFAVQLMYLDDSIETLRRDYFALVTDLVRAAPSTTKIIDDINNEILTGQLYKALRAAKKLISYERDLLLNAETGDAGIPDGSQADR